VYDILQNAIKALEFLYVNVIGCYFIENEGLRHILALLLTFSEFMAYFFKYVSCLD